MQRYIIGDHELLFDPGELLLFQDKFIERFLAHGEKANIDGTIAYELVPQSLSIYADTPILNYSGSSEVRQTQRGKLMICHWGRLRYAYGFFLDELISPDPVRCYYDPAMSQEIPLSISRFLSLAGLSSKLLQQGKAVFHCSYIDCGGEALLFAGFSGAGKSTQGALWEQCGKGQIINGDRALIGKKDGRWLAYGYPCCGSSDICMNRTLPIKAIAFLEKGERNEILSATPSTLLRRLFLGFQVYPWVQSEVDSTYRIGESVLRDVPVFAFSATKTQEAVDFLEQYLRRC